MRFVNFVHRRRKLLSCLSLVLIMVSCIAPSCFASETDTDSVDQILDVMGRFSEKALGSQGIGSQVISFITSNPLCLIGVACFVLIALVGLVRKFIIGA